MSSAPTCPGTVDLDDDGVISFVRRASRNGYGDFVERLDLYRSAPEQFVARSQAEMEEMKLIDAEMMAEDKRAFEEAEPEEREQREAEEEAAREDAASEYDPADWPWSWEL